MDISIENWNPQDHHEELLKNTLGVTIPTCIYQATTLEEANIEPEETLNLIAQFDNTNGSSSPSFFDCDEDELFDIQHEEEKVFHDTIE